MATSKDTKIIAIIGATGNQGSSVAKTFLSLPNWKVRCITRSPTSEKSQALKQLGAELFQADLNDASSLEPAFADVSAIFVNTDFWEVYRRTTDSQLAYNTEVQQGKNAVDAASRVPTLERFVYSALGPMKKASGGKYTHSWHWESKATVVEYIDEVHAEGLAKKTSLIYMGGYATNPFLMPKLDPRSGEYVLALPGPATVRMPIINAWGSTGPFVRALVEDEAPGMKLLAYDTDSYLTAAEVVDVWSRVSGKKAMFVEMSLKAIHEATGLPLEVLDGPAFVAEFGYMGGVEGFIEPGQLKYKIVTPSWEKFLRTMSSEHLLGSKKSEV